MALACRSLADASEMTLDPYRATHAERFPREFASPSSVRFENGDKEIGGNPPRSVFLTTKTKTANDY